MQANSSVNIAELLHTVSKRHPSKIAVIERDREITYGALWDTIERLAGAFVEIGISEGHRVALLLPNGIDFIICFFSLLKINAIVSPLNPDTTPHEFKTITQNLEPHAIIAIHTFINRITQECPELLEDRIRILQNACSLHAEETKWFDLHRLYEAEFKSRRANDTAMDSRHTATISYTYRGLGYPLGATLSHYNYIEGVTFYNQRTELKEHQKVLLVLPLYHIFPLTGGVLAPLAAGATVVFCNNYMIRSILSAIEKYGISVLLAVPSLYCLLLKYTSTSQYDLSSLEVCISGGAHLSAEVQEKIMERLNINIIQGYGLTECLPVTCNPPSRNVFGSIGPAGRNDVKIRIVDEVGNDRKVGDTGEIILKSPTLMSEYYGRADTTNAVLKNGWFYTGDCGYLDAEGYLFFTGRKKNIAKVGGHTVDLNEVRGVLSRHPFILDASVFAREDELWGQIIAVKINPRVAEKITEKEIREYCGKYLSSYKVPKLIEVNTEVSSQ